MPLFESPSELGVRLDALNDAFNALRNDVLGRGIAPPSYATPYVEEVATTWDNWRRWYETAAADVIGAVTGSYDRELDWWQTRYEELYSQLATARIIRSAPAPTHLPQPASVPVKIAPVEAPAVNKLSRAVMWGSIVVAAAAIGVVLLRQARA